MNLWTAPLELRPVTPGDEVAVLDIYRQCEDFLALGPVPTASMDMVRTDLEVSRRDGGLFCGIYTADGTMIGVVDYIPGNYHGDSRVAYLALLMIAGPFRKLGVGRAVVEAVEQQIGRDKRVTTIQAGVQVNNPDAIRFWQKNGYRIISGPELMPDQTTVFGLQKDFNRVKEESKP